MSTVRQPVPDMHELHKWRQRLGISRERVAARLHLSSKTIERWEMKGSDPGEWKRLRLAELYADVEARPEEYAA